MASTIRIVLVCVVLLAIGGIGYTQVDWSKVASGGGSGAAQKTSLIKSTSTTTRVGGDKTITIQQKRPGLIMQIRMMFGYQPKNAHQADLQRLKRQRDAEAARSKGTNHATGRKESTRSTNQPGGSSKRKSSAPNKSLKSALGG